MTPDSFRRKIRRLVRENAELQTELDHARAERDGAVARMHAAESRLESMRFDPYVAILKERYSTPPVRSAA